MVIVVGLQLPRILSGASSSSRPSPGLELLAYDAIGHRDYPMILGITVLTGTAVIIVNLLTDIAYALVDLRIAGGDYQ